MRRLETPFADVALLEPKVFGDDRGFFMETWTARAFADLGIEAAFVQDNQSRSQRRVLRGLHYQIRHPQGKLVRAVSGAVYDVIVDLRASSPTFGRSHGFELSAENKYMLWVPPGFAHGFLALQDDTDFLYKCTDTYHPEHERSLLWCDPALAIDWPLDGVEPLLTDKDRAGKLLVDSETFD